MRTLILEPSAAIEFILGRKYAGEIESFLTSSHKVIAPDLFVSEVPAVFSKYHDFDKLPIELCEEAMFQSLLLVDDFLDSRLLMAEADKLAKLNNLTIHEAIYLLLAINSDGIMLTTDPRLLLAAKACNIQTLLAG